MNSDIKVIKLSDFGASLGTREFGKRIREDAISFVRKGQKVIFDFSHITIISSAFADELFGKLFVEFGEEVFKNHIKVNMFDNEEVKSLVSLIINKSIDFRKRELDQQNNDS